MVIGFYMLGVLEICVVRIMRNEELQMNNR
jgi:hypothetical protein